jgi:hypothetical protein
LKPFWTSLVETRPPAPETEREAVLPKLKDYKRTIDTPWKILSFRHGSGAVQEESAVTLRQLCGDTAEKGHASGLGHSHPQQPAIRHALVSLHFDLGFLVRLVVGNDQQRLRPIRQVEEAVEFHGLHPALLA